MDCYLPLDRKITRRNFSRRVAINRQSIFVSYFNRFGRQNMLNNDIVNLSLMEHIKGKVKRHFVRTFLYFVRLLCIFIYQSRCNWTIYTFCINMLLIIMSNNIIIASNTTKYYSELVLLLKLQLIISFQALIPLKSSYMILYD